MAAVREREMDACMAVLGVTEHHWLGYPDGGCHLVDDDEAAAKLGAIIAEVEPDTVLTFGPEGMTGHPDHMAVSRWSKRAIELAGREARLLYATHTPEWAEAFRAVGAELNVMMADIDLPTTPVEAAAVFICAENELLSIKERAMLAQASQVKIMVDSLGPELYRQLLEEEVFRAAS
jgi:LmbE family N-acetylglucosaminyl deacetylase